MSNTMDTALIVQGSVRSTDLQKTDNTVYVAERFEQQYRQVVELFGPLTTVTALAKWLHTVRGSVGDIVSAQAYISVQASGADRTINVDIQKSTGGAAFATVMSATIAITNATAVRTAVTGTFSDLSLVAGDILQASVTVAGAAGAQAMGLNVALTIRERPD